MIPSLAEVHATPGLREKLPVEALQMLAQRTYDKIQKENWEHLLEGTLFSQYKILAGGKPINITIASQREGDRVLMVVGEESEMRTLTPADDKSNWLEKFKGDKAQPERYVLENGSLTKSKLVSEGAHRVSTENKDAAAKN